MEKLLTGMQRQVCRHTFRKLSEGSPLNQELKCLGAGRRIQNLHLTNDADMFIVKEQDPVNCWSTEELSMESKIISSHHQKNVEMFVFFPLRCPIPVTLGCSCSPGPISSNLPKFPAFDLLWTSFWEHDSAGHVS